MKLKAIKSLATAALFASALLASSSLFAQGRTEYNILANDGRTIIMNPGPTQGCNIGLTWWVSKNAWWCGVEPAAPVTPPVVVGGGGTPPVRPVAPNEHICERVGGTCDIGYWGMSLAAFNTLVGITSNVISSGSEPWGTGRASNGDYLYWCIANCAGVAGGDGSGTGTD
jgi:hypothetical protein